MNWLATAVPSNARTQPTTPDEQPEVGALERHQASGCSPCDQPLVRSTPNSTNRSVVLISIVLMIPTIPDQQRQADGHHQELVDLAHQRAEVRHELVHAPGVDAGVGLLDRRAQTPSYCRRVVGLDVDSSRPSPWRSSSSVRGPSRCP